MKRRSSSGSSPGVSGIVDGGGSGKRKKKTKETCYTAERARFNSPINSTINARAAGVPVTFSIDVAGRRIYGAEDDTPLFPEGDAAAAAAAAGVGAAGSGGGDGSGAAGDALAGGGTSVYGGSAAERAPQRKTRGPTVDLMGPTGQKDMSLGARHGVLKEQNIGKAALEGRANEIYDLLMASVLSAPPAGGGKGGAGRGRVQHDTDRSAVVLAVDAPDEDADGAGGCFADADDGAASEAGRAVAGPGGGCNEGVGAFVDEHAGDAGMCLSMHQPWASLGELSIAAILTRGCFRLCSLLRPLLPHALTPRGANAGLMHSVRVRERARAACLR